ncbi:MAG: radical SAM protein [Deltaproteobacteria bacterium]|nr:radical SAM protein [Deltaproteobacteria bacterium]
MKRSLIIFVTAACDSKCKHCFYYENIDGPQRTTLSINDTRRLANALGPINDLSIGGGEPVLRKDLVPLLEPILRQGRPRSVNLPTGGLHAERTERAARGILEVLPQTRLTISLSMDGPPAIHDRMRGVPGAYERQIETHDRLAPLARAGVINIKLVTTLCSLNQDYLYETLECAKSDFPAADFQHLEMMRGQPRDASLQAPDPGVLDQWREAIAKHWEGYRKFYGGGWRNKMVRSAKLRLHDLSVDYLRGVDNMPPCIAYQSHLVISETGDIAFCELTDPIGNLADDELPAILASAEAARRAAFIKDGCSCTHSCFTPTNLLHDRRELARLAADTLRAF